MLITPSNDALPTRVALAFSELDCAVPGLGITTAPLQVRNTFRQQAWCNVVCNEGCFHQKGARATHWVDKDAICMPYTVSGDVVAPWYVLASGSAAMWAQLWEVLAVWRLQYRTTPAGHSGPCGWWCASVVMEQRLPLGELLRAIHARHPTPAAHTFLCNIMPAGKKQHASSSTLAQAGLVHSCRAITALVHRDP